MSYARCRESYKGEIFVRDAEGVELQRIASATVNRF